MSALRRRTDRDLMHSAAGPRRAQASAPVRQRFDQQSRPPRQLQQPSLAEFYRVISPDLYEEPVGALLKKNPERLSPRQTGKNSLAVCSCGKAEVVVLQSAKGGQRECMSAHQHLSCLRHADTIPLARRTVEELFPDRPIDLIKTMLETP
jgi:hypothetical protein